MNLSRVSALSRLDLSTCFQDRKEYRRQRTRADRDHTTPGISADRWGEVPWCHNPSHGGVLIAMVKPWPIEIDGLPWFTVLKNGDFPWQTVK
jgi:hypothetical protein